MISKKGIRVEISCCNINCKHYFENMCLREWGNNELIFLDREGKCKQFIEGRNDSYNLFYVRENI